MTSLGITRKPPPLDLAYPSDAMQTVHIKMPGLGLPNHAGTCAAVSAALPLLGTLRVKERKHGGQFFGAGGQFAPGRSAAFPPHPPDVVSHYSIYHKIAEKSILSVRFRNIV